MVKENQEQSIMFMACTLCARESRDEYTLQKTATLYSEYRDDISSLGRYRFSKRW